jgi:hypothetical protein
MRVTGQSGSSSWHGLVQAGLGRVDRGRRLLAVEAALCVWTLLAAGLPAISAAQTGSCVGDCDGNGIVTVAELLQGIGIALGNRARDDCPSFDTNNDQRVTVDELVRGVTDALNGCGMNEELVKASADAALMAPSAISQAIKIIDFGAAGVYGGGAGALRAGRRHSLQGLSALAALPGPTLPPPTGGAAGSQLIFCAAGGTVEVSCFSNGNGDYTFQASYFNCTFFDQLGSEITRNGSFVQTSSDPVVCNGETPTDSPVTLTFTDFNSTQVDFDGTTTFRDALQLTDVFSPAGQGCAGLNSGQGFDGDLFIEVDAPSGEPVYAVDLFATDFIVASNSTGSPCQTAFALDGSLDSTDDLTSEDSSLNFSRFFEFYTPHEDGSSDVSLQGGIVSACLGTLQIETLQTLRFDTPDDLCPSAGVLRSTLPDQTVGRIQFSPDGVDFNGDGIPDVSSCLDRSIQQCPGQCTLCESDQDCPGTLGCFSCSADCASDAPMRCAPQDDFADCGDGSY